MNNRIFLQDPDGQVASNVGDEILVLKLSNGESALLKGGAAKVYSAVAGSNGAGVQFSELAALAPLEEVESIVTTLVDQGLLLADDQASLVSRRELLAKAGHLAAAGLLVSCVALPEPAAAASTGTPLSTQIFTDPVTVISAGTFPGASCFSINLLVGGGGGGGGGGGSTSIGRTGGTGGAGAPGHEVAVPALTLFDGATQALTIVVGQGGAPGLGGQRVSGAGGAAGTPGGAGGPAGSVGSAGSPGPGAPTGAGGGGGGSGGGASTILVDGAPTGFIALGGGGGGGGEGGDSATGGNTGASGMASAGGLGGSGMSANGGDGGTGGAGGAGTAGTPQTNGGGGGAGATVGNGNVGAPGNAGVVEITIFD